MDPSSRLSEVITKHCSSYGGEGDDNSLPGDKGSNSGSSNVERLNRSSSGVSGSSDSYAAIWVNALKDSARSNRGMVW